MREFRKTDIVLVGICSRLLGKLADVVAKGPERYWLRWHLPLPARIAQRFNTHIFIAATACCTSAGGHFDQ